MKNRFRFMSVLLVFGLFVSKVSAYKDSTWAFGIGYYSQNAFNRTTQDISSKTSFLGEPNYPFNLSYDMNMASNWFFSPQFGLTLFSRKTKDDAAQVSMTSLMFQFGQNFSSSDFDWSIGPGIILYQIKGAGGTKTLNNGTSTTNFTLPGSTKQFNKVTINAGSSYTFGMNRIGLDLIVENFFSNTKRAESLMLSYAYLFGGGGFSQPSRRSGR